MEEKINTLYHIIANYRFEDGYKPSIDSVSRWINQFNDQDREFILDELIHVFEHSYWSKDRYRNFIRGIVSTLKETLGYSDYPSLLDSTTFLDLQEEGKSQKVMLDILKEILKTEFNYSYDNLSTKEQKHYVYLDDVLCTGNTFYNNILTWINEESPERLNRLKDKSITLHVYYILVSKPNLKSKNWQFHYKIQNNFSSLYSIAAVKAVDVELLQPIEGIDSETLTSYSEKVTEEVVAYAESKGFSPKPPAFYRQAVEPETYYSSSENRERLEKALAEKGVEILEGSNVSKSNIRPLGFSLPSHRNFGFGLMLFTWRNVANNTPLVFWYKTRTFEPLFINKR